MPLLLLLYRTVSWVLEPFTGLVLRQRLRRGKERADRAPERFGRGTIARPEGPLLWMHGASVGEAGLLLDVFAALKRRRPELMGLLTTQTLTSADMAAARAQDGVIHQMAPVDGPRATARFWTYWRPDAGVLAEGEIWPNLLLSAKRRAIPLVFANARMTEKSRTSWRNRKQSANTLFSVFDFIGAADQDTADALEDVLDRPVNVVGNLKRAVPAPSADAAQLEVWREALKNRHVLLAASTHAGEEALALRAFSAFKRARPDLETGLIIAPRHPDRADEVETEIRAAGHTFKRRTADPSASLDDKILLADTIGEMGLWLRLANSVYLGGAHAPGVGGHNPIEPLRLKTPTFTGPEAFNFADLNSELEKTGALQVGDADALAQFWANPPAPDWDAVAWVLARSDAPFEATLDAIENALDKGSRHA